MFCCRCHKKETKLSLVLHAVGKSLDRRDVCESEFDVGRGWRWGWGGVEAEGGGVGMGFGVGVSE